MCGKLALKSTVLLVLLLGLVPQFSCRPTLIRHTHHRGKLPPQRKPDHNQGLSMCYIHGWIGLAWHKVGQSLHCIIFPNLWCLPTTRITQRIPWAIGMLTRRREHLHILMNPGRPWPPQNHVMPAQSTLDYMKHIFILQLSESIIKTCLSGKAGLEKCMSLFHRTGKVLCMQHLLSLLNRRENKLGEALVEVVAPTTTNTITETEMKTVATSPRQDTTADEESNATTVSQHWPRLLWPRPRM